MIHLHLNIDMPLILAEYPQIQYPFLILRVFLIEMGIQKLDITDTLRRSIQQSAQETLKTFFASSEYAAKYHIIFERQFQLPHSALPASVNQKSVHFFFVIQLYFFVHTHFSFVFGIFCLIHGINCETTDR